MRCLEQHDSRNMENRKYANHPSLTPCLAIITDKATPTRTTASPAAPTTLTATLLTFLALYVTTLFSLDTWAAARGSPYRAPANDNSLYRPAVTAPAPGSYQGGMHGQGRAGPGSGSRGRGSRDVGSIAQARDSRPPIQMGGTAGCGACLI
jgi:hypothetical protein